MDFNLKAEGGKTNRLEVKAKEEKEIRKMNLVVEEEERRQKL
jgi:hypothetical protein